MSRLTITLLFIPMLIMGCGNDNTIDSNKSSKDGGLDGGTDSTTPLDSTACLEGITQCLGDTVMVCQGGTLVIQEDCALTQRICQQEAATASCAAPGADASVDTGADIVDAGPPVDTTPKMVTVGFCNTVVSNGGDLILSVKVESDGTTTTLEASSNCCEACVEIPASEEVAITLFENGAVKDEATIALSPDNENVIVAILETDSETGVVHPGLGMEDATAKSTTCQKLVDNTNRNCPAFIDTAVATDTTPKGDAGL